MVAIENRSRDDAGESHGNRPVPIIRWNLLHRRAHRGLVIDRRRPRPNDINHPTRPPGGRGPADSPAGNRGTARRTP
jgi:hypothetical protein